MVPARAVKTLGPMVRLALVFPIWIRFIEAHLEPRQVKVGDRGGPTGAVLGDQGGTKGGAGFTGFAGGVNGGQNTGIKVGRFSSPSMRFSSSSTFLRSALRAFVSFNIS